MKRLQSRRGSALLIVLGMLAFMIVSAVGFAAYMRYSRLPSSYLRRSSASRMLAKAAVAEAIDAIDLAVSDNPHPGVGTKWLSSDRMGTGAGDVNRNRNVWISRVLFGTNSISGVNFGDGAGASQLSSLLSSDREGVATPLCLEALAYIPTPLVNEARFLSKLTPTAQWKSFGFDVGRYCFLALDVSDYFDVNRLMADMPRSSSSNGRISLAYMFENGAEHKNPGSGARQWDSFMDRYRTLNPDTFQVEFGGKYPLISVADFNLALGRQGGIGRIKSPFYDYVTSGGSRTGFYGTESTEDEDQYRRMTFVTDGWFPPARRTSASGRGAAAAEEGEDLLDLNDGANQPYAMNVLNTRGGASPSLTSTLMSQAMQNKDQWLSRLAGLGGAALFDYLDTDHVPVSLAIPTTERVPMICGIRPQFQGSSLAIRKQAGDMTGENGGALDMVSQTRRVEVVVSYKIDSAKFVPGFQGGDIATVVAYPFSHSDDKDAWPFNIDGRFSMFFSSDRMNLRTENAGTDILHLPTPMIPNSGLDAATGVMNVKLEPQPIAKFANIREPADAVKELHNRMSTGAGALGTQLSMEGNDLLRVTYRWTQTATTSMQGGFAQKTFLPEFDTVWQNPGAAVGAYGLQVEAHSAFKVLKTNGTVDPDFTDAKLREYILAGPDKGPKLYLNSALWLRVRSSDKTVDMVPACILDDKCQNNIGDAQMLGSVLGDRLGKAFPLMLFDPQVEFTLSVNELNAMESAPKEIKLTPEAAMVADPRFNHAPENWFAVSGNMTKETWLNGNHAKDNDRDGDIFMATSDAGYLQSKYELAFLPRLTNLKSYGSDAVIGNLPTFAARQKLPDNFADARQAAFMWRTYNPFDEDEEAFEDMPWTSEGNGFKVNPYSDSQYVLMAALANTPVDWKRASTNNVGGSTSECSADFESASEFNRKYAWNAYVTDESCKMTWETLSKIASQYMARVKAAGMQDKSWKDAWQEMDWYGDDNTFCDVPLAGEDDSLWVADRKFLYGYWRDCFAVKQQLYLVFVRAEPMMMGGDSGALAPPQLSARAMALVWRDPTASSDGKSPHQTRVLFYRQFD